MKKGLIGLAAIATMGCEQVIPKQNILEGVVSEEAGVIHRILEMDSTVRYTDSDYILYVNTNRGPYKLIIDETNYGDLVNLAYNINKGDVIEFPEPTLSTSIERNPDPNFVPTRKVKSDVIVIK